MTKLSANDLILDPAAYREQRTQVRADVMALRELRRISLGDRVVLVFENARTLTYQAQEMVYAEGITSVAAATHEVETYARLLPTPIELCATLLIEISDLTTVRDELARLRGLQHHIEIHVDGKHVGGVELPGPDEDGPNSETHSVHFVRFAFNDDARDAFRDPGTRASIVSTLPTYPAESEIDGATRLSLIADLNKA